MNEIFYYEPHDNQIIDSDYLICSGYGKILSIIKNILIYLDDKLLGEGNIVDNYVLEHDNFIFISKIYTSIGKHIIRIELLDSQNNIIDLKETNIYYNPKLANISILNIQLTNYCNLNCRWCSVSDINDSRNMDYCLFKSIIHQICFNNNLIVKEIMLQSAGESLLHPQLIDFVSYLGKFSNRPIISLVTNATILNKQISQDLINSKGLDKIFFSVDGGNKKSYEWLRRGSQYEKVCKNINDFLNINENHIIQTGIISIDLNAPFDNNFDDLIKKVDTFELRKPHNWTGNENLEDYNQVSWLYNYPCFFIKNNLLIHLNGDISPCCSDQQSLGIIGNILVEGIFPIWKGKRYELFLEHVKGNKKEIDFCKKCSQHP